MAHQIDKLSFSDPYASKSTETPSSLPIDLLGEEFLDQSFIVRSELDRVRPGVRLGVEVVRVKGEHILERLLVIFVHQVAISSFPVPRVERVESDHVKSSFRKRGLFLANHVLCEGEVYRIQRA